MKRIFLAIAKEKKATKISVFADRLVARSTRQSTESAPYSARSANIATRIQYTYLPIQHTCLPAASVTSTEVEPLVSLARDLPQLSRKVNRDDPRVVYCCRRWL